MSKLYITEYAALGSAVGGPPQIAAEPAIAVQVLDFTSAVQIATLSAQTRFVRLHNDAICSLRFDGSNATTSYARSPADTTEYYGVQGGSKVSVIANT